MRYLIVKGIAGFGDRLATLGRGIWLAKLTGRTLVIDWSDSSWNHDQPAKGFWHYFNLNGLPPSVKVVRGDTETSELIATLSASNTLTVLPNIYKGQLHRNDYSYNPADAYTTRLDGEPVQLTRDILCSSNADVLVFVGYNAGDLNDVLPFLTFKAPMTKEVPAKIGVHFRNTDKANDLDTILSQTKRVWRPGYSIYLATDDQHAAAEFREVFGNDVRTSSPPPRPANLGGIHHCSAVELAAVGLTKEELLHDMIRDILRLRNTTVFMGCPNSLFSRIVSMLRGADKCGK